MFGARRGCSAAVAKCMFFLELDVCAMDRERWIRLQPEAVTGSGVLVVWRVLAVEGIEGAGACLFGGPVVRIVAL